MLHDDPEDDIKSRSVPIVLNGVCVWCRWMWEQNHLYFSLYCIVLHLKKNYIVKLDTTAIVYYLFCFSVFEHMTSSSSRRTTQSVADTSQHKQSTWWAPGWKLLSWKFCKRWSWAFDVFFFLHSPQNTLCTEQQIVLTSSVTCGIRENITMPWKIWVS